MSDFSGITIDKYDSAPLRVVLGNVEQIRAAAKKKQELAIKAQNSTIKETKTRFPPKVMKRVKEQYAFDGDKGTFRLNTVAKKDDIEFIYTGRPLTPLHFRMTPKTFSFSGRGKDRVKKKKSLSEVSKATGARIYTIKAEIIKGQNWNRGEALRTRTRPGGPQAKKTRWLFGTFKGGNVLPFKRKSPDRKDYEVIHRLSVPQMISSKTVQPLVEQDLRELTEKRLDHNLQRFGLK